MAETESEEKSREDLSEEPSQRRIEELREKGMVAQSKEFTSVIVFFGIVAVLFLQIPQWIEHFLELFRMIFRIDLISKLDFNHRAQVFEYFFIFLNFFSHFLIPIAMTAIGVGILVSWIQIGSLFSWHPLMPDFQKINPLQGFQKFFSYSFLIESSRVILKSVFLISVSAFLFTFFSKKFVYFTGMEMGPLLRAYLECIEDSFFYFFGILFVFSGFDFLIQKWNYSKKIRLTKAEMKQEQREKEGDPQIKARIRSIQREVARRRMMKAVQTADVVITNPTHLAIAIRYEKDSMSAPKVVAKGADWIAQKMKQIALEAGVPLVENVGLARALYQSVKIGKTIPKNLYQAVAEVLAYVYRLKKGKVYF